MLFKTPRRLLVVLGAFGVFFTGVMLAFNAWQEYQLELSALKKNLQVDVRLLAEHVELSFAMVHRTLGELEDRFRRNGIEPFEQDKRYWEQLRRTLSRTPQLAQVGVTDAQGRIRFTTSAFPVPDFNVSDREYFQAHLRGESIHIGKPIIARVHERSLIPITLRMDGPGGEFLGVLFASLNRDYFQNFYSSLGGELNSRIGMVHADGTLLSLYPEQSTELTTEIQSRIREFYAHTEAGIHIVDSAIDGSTKVAIHQPLETYPVMMAISYDYGAFLTSSVYPLLVRNAIIFAVFAAATVLLVMLIRRAMDEAEEAREAQHASERLCRAIVQHLPRGRVAVFDRQQRYVFADGQAFSDRPSLASSNIVGKTISEIYPPEVHPLVEAFASDALAGHEVEGEISHRGNIYRVMAVPLENEQGAVEQGMFVTHDITEFRQTQEALETLSATDGLLGIANRREFDRVLEHEWRRLLREQQTLALLMIDADFFKLYNDTYGHQAGDECLRQIAHTLKEAVARPGDLVARYGGEEMVVLLPDTNLEGALQIAEHIQQALAYRAIPFPASTVADRVTVSIGAAAILPSLELKPAALIAEADSAVYAAKNAGRNTTCASVTPPFPGGPGSELARRNN